MIDSVNKIIKTYESVIKVIDNDAYDRGDDRAYGGVVRSTKGWLVEYMTTEIVKNAWHKIGGLSKRLDINSKKVLIPIKKEYISSITDAKVRKYISENIKDYVYELSVDKHIYIDNKFVSGIECKAYAENAMLKRILVDFHLLKQFHPHISTYLFQLESQLGGDYSELQETIYGSKSTHSIMSYFPDVHLIIYTFLHGERKVNKPIHKPKYYKQLSKDAVVKAINMIADDLKRFL